MKVGLFINTQFPEGFNLKERVPEMVEQVRAARDAGFASLWFPHHWLTHPMQMLQITPVMGYVAAHAQGMTIGPNILILPPLNPVDVAEEAATLDVLTGGNYILGVGLGYRQPEFDAFGISLSERAPRFNESIRLMRRLWTEERVSHKGRFYTVNDAGISVKPVRPAGPPLYIAGQAEVSVRRAARIGEAWLIVNTGGLGKVMPLMQTYRAALKEYGRAPMEFRSPSNAMLASATPRRMRNAGGRWNTSTRPMRHGDCRIAPRRVRSRISPVTGSSSAIRCR
jgi:alkanesulfonate monooxygenase SsuD/methylene tetrahydromethanopterin reductase-like flavin-dependent oxidoreductase (luciferase family)